MTESTYATIERKATELRERRPELTPAQAFVQTLDADWATYARMRAEEAAAAKATPTPELNPILNLYVEKLAIEARRDNPALTEAQAHVAALDRLSPELRAEFVETRRHAHG